MATGERVDDETLGGAEMHTRQSGLSDYLAADERDALRRCREIIATLNWPTRPSPPPQIDWMRISAEAEPPLYPAEELLGIVGGNVRRPFDPREVIARLFDGSRFHEFKPLYGPTLVCGWARLYGVPVGVIANNGVLLVDSCGKGTHFIHLCNQKRTPLVYLQNITGFMVGREAEQSGIVKFGAQLINAVSTARVPALTLVIGASYGAGNYAMCGRAYGPRLLFSWPNSRCSVMGPEQLTGTPRVTLLSLRFLFAPVDCLVAEQWWQESWTWWPARRPRGPVVSLTRSRHAIPLCALWSATDVWRA
jgi:acetyl-CoA carboxylase carboxyltransferase component